MSQPTQPAGRTDPAAAARAAQLAVVVAVTAELKAWIATGLDQPVRLAAAVDAALRILPIGAIADLIRTTYRRTADSIPQPPGRDRSPLDTTTPDRIVADTTARIEAAGRQVKRWAAQAHRDVITQAARNILDGSQSRRSAAAAAWTEIQRRGVTAFMDRSGRRWELASYVEMCTRTAVVQARAQAVTDATVADGGTLVRVSASPSTCRKCAPWAGRVLSLTTRGAHVETHPHAITGKLVRVRVAGSLAEAVDAGLFHPNCGHILERHIVGVTKPARTTGDPVRRGDQRQQLRAMERQVRAWKLREAAALTATDAATARANIRRWQATIRDHTRATGLRRQPHRERINAPR